jgi:hypothetical protein
VRPLLALVLAAALALTAASCGSGSETSPEDEVREAAVAAVGSKDAKRLCRTMVTDHFVEEVFGGDLKACVTSSIVDDNPGKPIVSTIALQGEDETAALVAVRMRGGESGGVAGHVRFAKEGEEWKLDSFENDYLRSVFDVGIGQIDEGAISTPAMQACMGKQFDKLSDQELRTFTFTSLADPAVAEKQVIALAERCRVPLAEYAADTFADALAEEDDVKPAYVECIRKELFTWLELTNISGELIVDKPSWAVVAALEGIAEGSIKNCKGE